MQSLQISSQNSTKGGRTFVCNSGNEKFLVSLQSIGLTPKNTRDANWQGENARL